MSSPPFVSRGSPAAPRLGLGPHIAIPHCLLSSFPNPPPPITVPALPSHPLAFFPPFPRVSVPPFTSPAAGTHRAL